jgi:ABC-2 type transport system permease protein
MFIIYGNGDDVMKKKQIIIEIIISSVKPFQLMIGKIIGTSLAGILQFFIWAFWSFFIVSAFFF